MPRLFDRIEKLGNPEALKKYKGTFLEKSLSDTASITEGLQLIDAMNANATYYRDYGLAMPPSRLIALDSGGLEDIYVEASVMMNEGFTLELPIHLFMAVEQGPPRDTSGDVGGPEKYPLQTQKGILMEVHDCCYRIAAYGPEGYRMICDEIDMAAQAPDPPSDDEPSGDQQCASPAPPAPPVHSEE